ncbi:DUF3194 domain-containing protein [Methanosphaera cuniculi]|uniref:DUF3194 domain-containing protein n=1 Tax=Methanosphaera cuniculi TaxID=1077256 RepID=A0A2A2HBR7_9EURY|nr:DUF3194 domain-containing protein [Methanosphaera cuniculi]PAV06807.1 hypothetical protein ASJ82_06575 [Methanosphaera cuniculi]PWL08870.1 hypothetical protein MSCUN_01960 [Methanosphaera cuniculi]
MKKLNDTEVDEIIDLAYNTASNHILKNVNKKDFEDIEIKIDLDKHEDSFDLDIKIELDSDVKLPENLSQEAIDAAMDAVDDYVADRKMRLNDY